jgi:hypothetical protein
MFVTLGQAAEVLDPAETLDCRKKRLHAEPLHRGLLWHLLQDHSGLLGVCRQVFPPWQLLAARCASTRRRLRPLETARGSSRRRLTAASCPRPAAATADAPGALGPTHPRARHVRPDPFAGRDVAGRQGCGCSETASVRRNGHLSATCLALYRPTVQWQGSALIVAAKACTSGRLQVPTQCGHWLLEGMDQPWPPPAIARCPWEEACLFCNVNNGVGSWGEVTDHLES